MEQLFMFGTPPELEEARRNRSYTRRNFGPAPKQKPIRIKLMRKIAFKRRFREQPGQGNDCHWDDELVIKLHTVILEDWQTRFPSCTNRQELVDYWLWMLGDPNEAFSFHDCLVADGYAQPYEVIDSVTRFVPDWIKAALEMDGEAQAQHFTAAMKADHTAAKAA